MIVWGDIIKFSKNYEEKDFKGYYQWMKFDKIDKEKTYISPAISNNSYLEFNNIKIPLKLIKIIDKNTEYHDQVFYKYRDIMCYDVRNRDYAMIYINGNLYDNIDIVKYGINTHAECINYYKDISYRDIRNNTEEKFIAGHIIGSYLFLDVGTSSYGKEELDTVIYDCKNKYNFVKKIYLFNNYSERDPEFRLVFEKE